MTRQELRVFLDDWFCGCDRPEDACKRLRDILALHPLHSNRAEFKRLIPDDGIEMLVLYTLDHFDLTEHGGSVGGGWLTETGKAVLQALHTEVQDGFEALFANHCAHGYAVDTDELLQCHECGPLNSSRK